MMSKCTDEVYENFRFVSSEKMCKCVYVNYQFDKSRSIISLRNQGDGDVQTERY